MLNRLQFAGDSLHFEQMGGASWGCKLSDGSYTDVIVM